MCADKTANALLATCPPLPSRLWSTPHCALWLSTVRAVNTSWDWANVEIRFPFTC
jgi:hypothetical protein